jgi:hypothetical protein
MKKILIYTALFAGFFAAVSCDKNLPPVFDDANAFVAFDKASASMDEAVVDEEGNILPQTEILRIPVTLGSVKGLAETIKFTVTDGTAKAGVNYNLLTTSGTLSFDASNRTAYIEIQPLYFDEYTGDVKFTIELTPSDNIAVGLASTCTVTIGDVNHPLTDLFGTYVATCPDSTEGETFKFSIFKDENDDHMVWFFNLFANSGWAADNTVFYGNVDDDMTTITIPYGQTSEYKYTGGIPVTLYWADLDFDGEGAGTGKTGSNTVTIVKDETGKVTGLKFQEGLGFEGLLEGLGYIGVVLPDITAEKQ